MPDEMNQTMGYYFYIRYLRMKLVVTGKFLRRTSDLIIGEKEDKP